MRRMLFAAAMASTLLVGRGYARAEMAEGDTLPDFEGKEFVNTEPCSFKSLRGHAVLVEVFRTW